MQTPVFARAQVADPSVEALVPSYQQREEGAGRAHQVSAEMDRRILPARGTQGRVDHVALGNVMRTIKPPSSRLRRLSRPPCASTISRDSARPKPVPLRLVE